MPGIQDLLALAQGGGGGAPPPQAGPPMPGGAPMPPGGGMGGALQQVLGKLMQDPVAMRGMQQYMQRMQGGGAPPMAAPPGNAQGGPPQGPMDMTQGIPPGMKPGDEQGMVSQEIDRKGATWDGVDAPTQNDIERLTADPSPINIKSFDDQFGQGAAEKYLGQEEGPPQGGDQSEESDEATPDKESSEY